MVEIYGIKNCDSVKAALRFFKNHEIPCALIDFRETPVDEATIRKWLKLADLKTLFNTRSTAYRALKLKTLDLSEKEKIGWLARENMLIKRPVVVFDDQVIIGYNESEYSDKLLP